MPLTLDTYFGSTDGRNLLPIARNHTGEPVAADTGSTGPFVCYGCNGPLVRRRAHKRSRPGGGGSSATGTTTFAVREHFVHVRSDATCAPESWIHRAAKEWLAHHPDHPFIVRCGGCGGEGAFRELPTGQRWVNEHPLANRVLDVALLDEHNVVSGAVEVHHTHACDDHKLWDLCETLGNRWCEVTAVDVISAATSGTPIPVRTCAVDACNLCFDAERRTTEERRTRLISSRAIVAELERTVREIGEANTAAAALRTEAIVARRRAHLLSCEPDSDDVLEFGKYRGVAVGPSLLAEDPGYVLWLAGGGSSDLPMDPRILSAARRLTKGLCRDCACPIGGPQWKVRCTDCHFQRR